MNILNRVLVILFAILVLAASTLVLIVTLGIISPQQLGIPFLSDVLQPFADLQGNDQILAIAIAAALLILALVLLVAELTPPSRDPKVTIKDDELGRVTVSEDGMRRLANREAGQVPGVMEVRSEVDQDKQGIKVRSRVSVDPASDVPQLTDEVRERVKGALERHLGREVVEVAVDAQIEPLDSSKRRRVR
jgi:hypothetical protein